MSGLPLKNPLDRPAFLFHLWGSFRLNRSGLPSLWCFGAGYEGTGREYGYDLQLIASNLWFENDSHIFSFRYYDGRSTERIGLGINARYRIGEAWRIQPRLWIEQRRSKRDSSDQWPLRPLLRAEYRWTRRYHIEVELGRDWSLREIPLYGDEEFGSNFFLFSYRVDIE